MTSKTPRQHFPRPPRRAAPLFPRLLISFTLALVAHAAAHGGQQPQQGNGAAPSPTPHVRPRTVGPKAEAPAPAPAAPAEQQPAGSSAPDEIDEDEVVRVETNLVLIPASVVDARGRAVADLRLEDFELKVDGEMKPISDLSRAETPVNIALLFDNSQSLSAAREFEKQAALRFLRSVVRPIDRAAVYSISTQPKLEHPFTNNVPRLLRTIENFGQPAGATALFDTIAQAADYIGPLAGRKVLVLVSDGSDTLSDINLEEALSRSLRAECQIYVVQTRQIEDPNLHDRFAEQVMQKLTEQTGGAVFVPRSVEDLDAAFTQISLDLSQQYVLGYNPQDERKDNYFRFINVSVRTRPHLRVRARKGFYPPGGKPGEEPPAGAEANRRPAPKAAPAATTTDAPRGKRESRAPAGRRGNNGAGRVGPAGPDEEERSKPAPSPAQDSDESRPTLTLTVAESSPPPTPWPAPADPIPTPSPTPRPAPTPAPAEAAATTPPPALEKKEDFDRTPVSGGVMNSKALNLPRPNYPPLARSAGVFGTVTVEVTIDERGSVSEARVVSGHPLLHHAAASAARQAKFSPTVLSGEPVKVKGTINYNFTKQ